MYENLDALWFFALGGLWLLGLAAHWLGQVTPLPRVTLLLLFGLVIGPELLDWIPPVIQDLYPQITTLALTMVGFLLGGKLSLSQLRRHGLAVLGLTLGLVMITGLVVFAGLFWWVPPALALVLAAIATATAPAATVDVIKERHAKGPFAQLLLKIVALDDALGLLLFSLALTGASALLQADGMGPLLTGLWELVGALALGIVLGLPMALLTGRISPGEPTLVEALGLVFLCAGLALWLEVSYLLSAMVLGTVVVNLARHHSRPFHAIEHIEWPFMVLFFVLAGASLDWQVLLTVGPMGVAFIALRFLGKLLGGWLSGHLLGITATSRRWLGPALLPQAGVALGAALLAAQTLPSYGAEIVAIVVAATVAFELSGPVLTRLALTRVERVFDDR